jgi:hypothetical protein
MRWNAYINRRLKNGDIETSKEVFELPNTTRADGRFATLHASKTYNMNEDAILCIPGCTIACSGENHTPECDEKYHPSAPIITKAR